MGAYRSGLRQLASGFIKTDIVDNSKTQWLDDFIDGYPGRIVIFYNYNGERDMIEQVCIKNKRNYSFYNGSSKDLTAFLENDDGIAICQYISASESINDLVVSQACVFYSPTDDYILFEQAKKRLDRIGQTGNPLLYYLQTTGTIETAIYRSLAKGKNFDDKMFEMYLQYENNNV